MLEVLILLVSAIFRLDFETVEKQYWPSFIKKIFHAFSQSNKKKYL